MRVAVIGTGYVGLSTGGVLAYLGHDVVGVDVDRAKIARLAAGEVPIHEPGLPELLALVEGRLRFTTSYAEAVEQAQVVFISVDTPSLPDGEPDLRAVRAAADAIGRSLGPELTVIVTKSTVPIGSGNWVDLLLREAVASRGARSRRADFAVASNPEFLSEGSAVSDALYPHRVVVGAEDERAVAVLTDLYRPLLNQSFAPPPFLPRPAGHAAVPLVTMDLASAELVKYAANAFLALKISFINDIGALAERVGADVLQIATGIGLDPRIGHQFLEAGVGWGGSCFGKDTAALLSMAREYGLDVPTVRAAREVNVRQRERVVEKLQRELTILKGRVVALLGVAFKPHTDDLRDAPAIDVVRALVARGTRVRVHDPVALGRARAVLGDGADVTCCPDVRDAVRDADAVLLLTQWPEYRELSWHEVRRLMRGRVVIDGRNVLERATLGALGFRYVGMGRGGAMEVPAAVPLDGLRSAPVA